MANNSVFPIVSIGVELANHPTLLYRITNITPHRARVTVYNSDNRVVQMQDDTLYTNLVWSSDNFFGLEASYLFYLPEVEAVSFYRIDDCVVCSVEAANRVELAHGEGSSVNDALKNAVADYADAGSV